MCEYFRNGSSEDRSPHGQNQRTQDRQAEPLRQPIRKQEDEQKYGGLHEPVNRTRPTAPRAVEQHGEHLKDKCKPNHSSAKEPLAPLNAGEC